MDAEVIDPVAFRRALGTFVSGVTVVTTEVDGEIHGMTANAFTSVSMEPPLVLVSIARSAKMDSRIHASGRYGVSILCRDQEQLSLHFAGAPLKRPEIPEFERRAGVPLVCGALVQLACSVYGSHPAGDHTLHVGRVEELWHTHGDPLVFFTGSFQALDVHQLEPELGF